MMSPEEKILLWLSEDAQGAIEKCESPIERLMFCAMFHMALSHTKPWQIFFEPMSCIGVGSWSIIPQFQIDSMRVDFLVQWGGFTRSVVVECDGHEFHERTREQVVRDNIRSRKLRGKHFDVMRFSGSEIHSDPLGCANEVHGMFCTLHEEGWTTS